MSSRLTHTESSAAAQTRPSRITALTARLPREAISRAIGRYLACFLLFAAVFAAMRGLEWLLASRANALPDVVVALYVRGLAFDLLGLAALGTALGILFLGVHALRPRAAVPVVGTIMGGLLLGYSLLLVYFAESLTPLGAEVFGYSMNHMRTAVFTAVRLDTALVLSLLGPAALFAVALFLARRMTVPTRWRLPVVALLALGTLGHFVAGPASGGVPGGVQSSLVTNKLGYFGGAVGRHVGGWFDGPVQLDDYPLYREARFDDVLGPHLGTADRPPNLVFIVIEGLGGSFIRPDAAYESFTPHLDSIAARSLYWPHFLATSSRSFEVFASLLGSLPYGSSGFTEMGFDMPDHRTLVSILNENDYFTAFFYGSDASYDNRDAFFARQDIDLVMDQAHFPPSYARMPEINGFSWGYNDKDTFRRAFEILDRIGRDTPRLDIYFTLNMHEPFYIPDLSRYVERFWDIVEREAPPPNRMRTYEAHPEVFADILYTDEAVAELLARYREREDYENTIFVITGDHRIAPVPHESAIDRYYVPFMIYSPLVEEPRMFPAVSSHLDVVPTLLAHLRSDYGLSVPDSVHWLGREIDTSSSFRSVRDVPFIRTKNGTLEYLAGRHYLSEGRLYELSERMGLRETTDSVALAEVQRKFEEFRNLNRFVMGENRIMPPDDRARTLRAQLAEEDSVMSEYQLAGESKRDRHLFAQQLAWNDERKDAMVILRRVLRESPTETESRVLMARIHGWERDYTEAERQLLEAKRWSPFYYDIFAALADLYFWQDELEKEIETLAEGIAHNPDHSDLLYRMARARMRAGDLEEAREVLRRALEVNPAHELAERLRNELLGG